MGKIIKRLLAASGILIVLGVIVCTVSIVAGANYKKLSISHKYKGKTESISEEFTGTINNLKIKICSGRFELKKGDRFKLVGDDVIKGSLKYSVDNGTLEITENTEDYEGFWPVIVNRITGWSNIDKKVTLYVPEGTEFQDVDIRMMAGKASIEEITAEQATFKMDAGALDVNKMTVKKENTVTVTAGKLELQDVSLRDSDLDVSAGKLIVDGSLYGKTKANISAGALEITTDLEESKYDFNTDVSAGSIKVNGKSYDEESIDNHAENSFDLNCSAGSIKVKTK